MYKELVICIVIIMGIVVLNFITENFTKESVSFLTDELNELRNEITEENIQNEEIKDRVNNIYTKFAYIKHNFSTQDIKDLFHENRQNLLGNEIEFVNQIRLW